MAVILNNAAVCSAPDENIDKTLVFTKIDRLKRLGDTLWI